MSSRVVELLGMPEPWLVQARDRLALEWEALRETRGDPEVLWKRLRSMGKATRRELQAHAVVQVLHDPEPRPVLLIAAEVVRDQPGAGWGSLAWSAYLLDYFDWDAPGDGSGA